MTDFLAVTVCAVVSFFVGLVLGFWIGHQRATLPSTIEDARYEKDTYEWVGGGYWL